mmetsp:Transcript_50787/g.149733  ORF Transcript_50787/g.149733 Transcript_50787/m.149733 type:complete len:222 (-) Transcript_50787:278-943(-)
MAEMSLGMMATATASLASSSSMACARPVCVLSVANWATCAYCGLRTPCTTIVCEQPGGVGPLPPARRMRREAAIASTTTTEKVPSMAPSPIEHSGSAPCSGLGSAGCVMVTTPGRVVPAGSARSSAPLAGRPLNVTNEIAADVSASVRASASWMEMSRNWLGTMCSGTSLACTSMGAPKIVCITSEMPRVVCAYDGLTRPCSMIAYGTPPPYGRVDSVRTA